MIRGDWETKINGTVSVRLAHFHVVSVNNLLRVDPPGLVNLFEKEESRVFRFPEKQQISETRKEILIARSVNVKTDFGCDSTIHEVMQASYISSCESAGGAHLILGLHEKISTCTKVEIEM